MGILDEKKENKNIGFKCYHQKIIPYYLTVRAYFIISQQTTFDNHDCCDMILP